MSKQDPINSLGKGFQEGTTSIEKSHLIFPILFYQTLGLTFVFGNQESSSKVMHIMVNSDVDINNININGAIPGMSFVEAESKLGQKKRKLGFLPRMISHTKSNI
ncbi:hypothetical protein EHS13_30055 [Paenibacillus psychroresistens]|uniref:Uncharacterized protein n=1 Tax=Paenibacillus psychroresistens TaxID=1778678 RepID=A0A6B8RR03_9BACL|nr:hypothetical protein [Paenibacillus psychroresistens]QGQ98821.1 hypothetical protein EHS13_30055 [Paenibacillus psychroresistens]